ncbi:MAG TPA: fimbria/pilus periplasmic chaperone [Sphingomicrobium sp.]|nr:fimbria/pilus periplasmic chaperone [Sphingomicrobium sp.]
MPRSIAAAMIASACLLTAPPAAAELVVSQLIVEFKPGAPKASDIELSNDSPERSYVLVEAREIVNPGTPLERKVTSPDPAKLGLLVSPARFILEPQQRRTLRIATIGAPSERERVYRVTVKPVTGALDSSDTGLKLLVGYDLLVLARPATIRSEVRVARSGRELTLTNAGNASVELAEGQQCDEKGGACVKLPGKRLYAGASWTQTLPRAAGGEYRLRSTDGWSSLKF